VFSFLTLLFLEQATTGYGEHEHEEDGQAVIEVAAP